jgi:hypothetical protein
VIEACEETAREGRVSLLFENFHQNLECLGLAGVKPGRNKREEEGEEKRLI